MNSEELELSLRAEFESYLKNLLAEMRQEAAEFQARITDEFDKHRSQIDEAFKSYSANLEGSHEFDDAFKETVTEHLRLAKDEGAKITATAFAEAEDMQKTAAPSIGLNELRDAVKDIKAKDSQSSILKALVGHAAGFAPRGAFFIIKNEQFVGWKAFGADADDASNAVREIHFPVSSETLLGAAASELKTVESAEGGRSDETSFLGPLQFGQPHQMYAIPLVARGRAVAVMYADHGTGSASVNIEALEMLVLVAGLTVELLASGQSDIGNDHVAEAADHGETYDDAKDTHFAPANGPADFAFSDSVTVQGGFPEAHDFTAPSQHEEHSAENLTDHESFGSPQPIDAASLSDELESYVPVAEAEPEHYEAGHSDGAIVFDSGGSIESAVEASSPFDSPVERFEPAAPIGASSVAHAIETAVEAVPGQVAAGRLSDRPVDLPIDVPESERRSHNDARRFARLLVSEIKLYNEKKVIEGRQANDLYDRLREAIDRSREMYDKRVQPPVAAKFDYFHYELVNALADGDASRLGAGYPGAAS